MPTPKSNCSDDNQGRRKPGAESHLRRLRRLWLPEAFHRKANTTKKIRASSEEGATSGSGVNSLRHGKTDWTKDSNRMSSTRFPVRSGCAASYIGQTTRRLETRIKEHRTACEKRQADKSATAAHSMQTGHQMDFANVRIIDRARNSSELLLREAIAVKNSTNNINSNDGLELSQQWTALKKIAMRR